VRSKGPQFCDSCGKRPPQLNDHGLTAEVLAEIAAALRILGVLLFSVLRTSFAQRRQTKPARTSGAGVLLLRDGRRTALLNHGLAQISRSAIRSTLGPSAAAQRAVRTCDRQLIWFSGRWVWLEVRSCCPASRVVPDCLPPREPWTA